MSSQMEGAQRGKIEYLKVDDLSLDPSINPRPLDRNRAKRMAADFDLEALKVIEVSRRNDGKNIILDGQHRCEALRVMGWNGEKIPCKVFIDLTRAQEAKHFRMCNQQVAIRYLDNFLSLIVSKDKVACDIVEIAKQNGFVIDRQARDGTIVAVRALEEIYNGKNQKIRGANPRALHGTLQAVSEAWGHTTQSVNHSVLSGVGAMLLRYGNDVKLARLIGKMKGISGGPQGLINRGRGKRELHGGSLASGIGHYLTDEYNGGLRGNGRLAAWRE